METQYTSLFDFMSTKLAILILHSNLFHSNNIIASLLTMKQLGGKTILLMVGDTHALIQAITVKLPDEMFISYDHIPKLMLTQSPVYVFVDNIPLFLQLVPTQNNPLVKFIFIGSLGLSSDDISQLNTCFPNLHTLYFGVYNNYPHLDFTLNTLIMTPSQSSLYDTLFTQDKHLECIQLANTLSDPHIPFELSNIHQYSPKFRYILTCILFHRQFKHVVYTQFPNKYGISTLQTLLDKLNISYITITNIDTYNERVHKINTFNSSSNLTVLLTTVVPVIDLHNIYHLHLVEAITHTLYLSLINKIYKKHLYTSVHPLSSPSFKVHIYIIQKSDGSDAIDAYYYRPFSKTLHELTHTYNHLISQSLPIYFVKDIGFSIIPKNIS